MLELKKSFHQQVNNTMQTSIQSTNTNFTSSKVKKNEREMMLYKKNQQTKQIKMWPVTFNMLYLIFCKCSELVPDVKSIISIRKDLNGQIAQLSHSIEAKIKMQRGEVDLI